MDPLGPESFGAGDSKVSSAWTWLLSEAGMLAIAEAASAGEDWDTQKQIRWLRKKFDAQQSALIVDQLRLRERARRKFSNPALWYWTQKLLEQSSDEQTAAHTASCFPANVRVVDLCCGAGSDSVALAQSHEVIFSNDVDALVCRIAEANFRNHRLQIPIVQSRSEDVSIPTNAWVHIDPDRRMLANRATRLEKFMPPQEYIEKLRREHAGGSIKLAPGSPVPDTWPAQFGLHWIAFDATVRQLRAWWGVDAFQPRSRAVSVGKLSREWLTYRLSEDELDIAKQEVEITTSCAEWIGDVDPAFRISGLLAGLARDAEARMFAAADGFLVSSKPLCENFIRWLQIEDILPIDEKKLRKYFRERSVGILEIKQRHTKFDIDRLRNSLQLEGDASRSLFITKVGSAIQGIIASECQRTVDAESANC